MNIKPIDKMFIKMINTLGLWFNLYSTMMILSILKPVLQSQKGASLSFLRKWHLKPFSLLWIWPFCYLVFIVFVCFRSQSLLVLPDHFVSLMLSSDLECCRIWFLRIISLSASPRSSYKYSWFFTCISSEKLHLPLKINN